MVAAQQQHTEPTLRLVHLEALHHRGAAIEVAPTL